MAKTFTIIALLAFFCQVGLAGGNDGAFLRYAMEGKVSERVLEVYVEYADSLDFQCPSQSLGLNIVLIVAIADVESSFNLFAVGDEGKANGMFQLHQEAIDQVYKVTHLQWSKGLRTADLYKYPLRQFQIAVEYLRHWHSVGGADSMLRYWNHTPAWNKKIQEAYQKWYRCWREFNKVTEEEILLNCR